MQHNKLLHIELPNSQREISDAFSSFSLVSSYAYLQILFVFCLLVAYEKFEIEQHEGQHKGPSSPGT